METPISPVLKLLKLFKQITRKKPAMWGTRGRSEVSVYFCKHCGVRLGPKGYIEEIGGDYMSVTIAALDNITPSELAELPVNCMDGANDNWYSVPKVTKHL